MKRFSVLKSRKWIGLVAGLCLGVSYAQPTFDLIGPPEGTQLKSGQNISFWLKSIGASQKVNLEFSLDGENWSQLEGNTSSPVELTVPYVNQAATSIHFRAVESGILGQPLIDVEGPYDLSVDVSDANEPNNTKEEATSLEFGAPGQGLIDVDPAQEDKDYFSFSGTAGKLVSVNVDGEFNMSFKVFAPNGDQVGKTNSSEFLVATNETGVYTIEITQRDESDYGEYTITLTESDLPALTITSPVGGASWNSGSEQTISWDFGLEDVEYEVRLINGEGNGERLTKTNDKSMTFSVPLPDQDITTAKIKVMVEGVLGEEIMAMTEAFTISPVTTDANEPNNDEENATAVNLGDTVTASLYSGVYGDSDEDWYKIIAAEDSKILLIVRDFEGRVQVYGDDYKSKTINASGVDTLPLNFTTAGTYYLQIKDTDGPYGIKLENGGAASTISVDAVADQQSGAKTTVTWTGTEDIGEVDIFLGSPTLGWEEIGSSDNDGTEEVMMPYFEDEQTDIHVKVADANSPVPAEGMSGAFTIGGSTDLSEDNDSLAVATTANVGDSIEGIVASPMFDAGKDDDWFKIMPSEGQRLSIIVRKYASNQIMMELYNSGGNRIEREAVKNDSGSQVSLPYVSDGSALFVVVTSDNKDDYYGRYTLLIKDASTEQETLPTLTITAPSSDATFEGGGFFSVDFDWEISPEVEDIAGDIFVSTDGGVSWISKGNNRTPGEDAGILLREGDYDFTDNAMFRVVWDENPNVFGTVEGIAIQSPTSLGSLLPLQAGITKFNFNPLQGRMNLTFGMTKSGPVRLDIYSPDGRLVNTLIQGTRSQGYHSVSWLGRPGVYFLKLEVEGQSLKRKFTLSR